MQHQISGCLKAKRSFGIVVLACLLLTLQTGCGLIKERGVNPEVPVDGGGKPDPKPVPEPKPVPKPTPKPLATTELNLQICKMKVSNRPANIGGKVSRISSTGCINGVSLMVAPAPRACLTSGYGDRDGKAHTGLDFQSRPAGNVVAAGDGDVIFRGERKRFGNWVLIDHGSDVYTAYAHLAFFNPKIKPGAKVSQGQVLGVMGDTGQYIFATHLHFEIRQGALNRTGDVATNYFFLDHVNPFDMPESCAAS